MELLTSREAAQYLRLKERKLYELVATGGVPCTKVTGRWLFPKVELDRWLLESLAWPEGLVPPQPAAIVGGSQDPLLEWALHESGSGLASLPEGSERGLERFSAHEVLAAAIHLHALESEAIDANTAFLRAGGFADTVLVAFVRREQGLVVPPGNPRGLTSLADVVAQRARMAQRPKGAGAQLLFLALLHRDRLAAEAIVAGPMCPTGLDIGQAIRAGRADCGIASRSVANGAGLGFVPLAWEPFDLVMRQRDYFREPLQALLRFLRTAEFAERAQEAGGYDIGTTGAIRFAP